MPERFHGTFWEATKGQHLHSGVTVAPILWLLIFLKNDYVLCRHNGRLRCPYAPGQRIQLRPVVGSKGDEIGANRRVRQGGGGARYSDFDHPSINGHRLGSSAIAIAATLPEKAAATAEEDSDEGLFGRRSAQDCSGGRMAVDLFVGLTILARCLVKVYEKFYVWEGSCCQMVLEVVCIAWF